MYQHPENNFLRSLKIDAICLQTRRHSYRTLNLVVQFRLGGVDSYKRKKTRKALSLSCSWTALLANTDGLLLSLSGKI